METAKVEAATGRTARYSIFFAGLLGLLVSALLLNIGMGAVKISVPEVVNIILKQSTDNDVHEAIVWKIRLPRALATILGGAALAVSGLLLQVFFRNPIVGPFVLGISSGASLAVGLIVLAGVTFGLGTVTPFTMFLAAFIGAIFVMAMVLLIANRVKSVVTLLVIGLMVGYLVSAITSLLMAFAQKEQVHGFVMWTLGSYSGFTWNQIYVLAAVGIPLLLATFLMCKPLNAFLLGEDYAKSMGVNIKAFRFVIVLIASALAAVITAFTGPVAFIGMAVPHLGRTLFQTSDNRILIPATILLGAAITALCDLIARTMFSPVEVPISAVTSFFGAPIVILMLLKRRNAL
jgi:iron complex transport system permease protein